MKENSHRAKYCEWILILYNLEDILADQEFSDLPSDWNYSETIKISHPLFRTAIVFRSRSTAQREEAETVLENDCLKVFGTASKFLITDGIHPKYVKDCPYLDP